MEDEWRIDGVGKKDYKEWKWVKDLKEQGKKGGE